MSKLLPALKLCGIFLGLCLLICLAKGILSIPFTAGTLLLIASLVIVRLTGASKRL